jgi:hypothetical protein
VRSEQDTVPRRAGSRRPPRGRGPRSTAHAAGPAPGRVRRRGALGAIARVAMAGTEAAGAGSTCARHAQRRAGWRDAELGRDLCHGGHQDLAVSSGVPSNAASFFGLRPGLRRAPRASATGWSPVPVRQSAYRGNRRPVAPGRDASAPQPARPDPGPPATPSGWRSTGPLGEATHRRRPASYSRPPRVESSSCTPP